MGKKNIQEVNEDVLHLFQDLAKSLIQQYDGDAEKALMVALAFSSGHYKHKLEAKSLLNGQEGMQTIILKSTMTRGRLANGSAYNILKKYWDPKTVEHVKNMKTLRNGSGVVFDLRADWFEAFLENFPRLYETNDRVDFDV